MADRSPLRVVQIVDSLKMGGAERMVTLLAREAAGREQNVSVLSLRDDLDPLLLADLEASGTPFFCMPTKRPFGPARVKKLGSFLREQKFDLVQTHLATANIVGVLAAFFAGAKVIGTLHSIDAGSRRNHPLKYKLETQTLRYAANRVIAVGTSVAESQYRRLQRPIDVVPNAVRPLPDISYTDRCAIRKRLTGDAENPLLISVGRLSAPKGYDVLIQAFTVVRNMYQNARLLIAGAGTLEDELEQLIIRLGLEGSVHLLGRREDVPELLAASDVYVNASLWEGLPVSILEAMSAGLPIVATSVGDIPHIVPPDAGIVVPPGDPAPLATAICKILQDPQAAMRMGKNAKQLAVTQYSPSAWIDRLLRIYDEVFHLETVEQAI